MRILTAAVCVIAALAFGSFFVGSSVEATTSATINPTQLTTAVGELTVAESLDTF